MYYLLHTYDICKVFYNFGGGVRQGGTWSDIYKMELLIPPCNEQQKIADYLDKKIAQLDRAKRLLEKQIQKLKDYRSSLIYETVTKGLDKTVPMKDSGIDWIGQVPEGWGVSKLKFTLEKASNNIKVGPFGSSLSGDAIRSSGKWVYNQRNVLDNNFTETDTFISDAKWKD
ncbi:type I restriction-modification system [Streptococcus sanguinis SK1056]|uniref:Type I restriction-modification system n=1 Tax=Streptococcus sanguinis SK1056 TaxID=888820 RepID=F3U9A1_STRSA|nr:restriction endonuclease subunit S [Streptococcus sanguinis]EGJ40206.1 type I restriction-modification system [Streptococcus sanguinis SK1056]